MQCKKVFKFFLVTIFGFVVIFSSVAFGAASSASMGDVASNIFEVGMTVGSIIRSICMVVGCGLILASLLQYKKYRQNHIETTFGTVMFTFVVGVAIICLSFVPIDL